MDDVIKAHRHAAALLGKAGKTRWRKREEGGREERDIRTGHIKGTSHRHPGFDGQDKEVSMQTRLYSHHRLAIHRQCH